MQRYLNLFYMLSPLTSNRGLLYQFKKTLFSKCLLPESSRKHILRKNGKHFYKNFSKIVSFYIQNANK